MNRDTVYLTVYLDEFISFFRGRGDCYGSWQGGCVKEPLTRTVFEQHLTAGPHIGVYPLIGDKVSWGCIDIDGKDHPMRRTATAAAIEVETGCPRGSLQPEGWDWDTMWEIAHKLVSVLAVKDVHAYTEKTANGIHVWVFPVEPLIAAETMRRALMAACTAIGYEPKEVNPKSLTGGKQGIGNYVRLPYYGAFTHGTPKDRFFVHANDDTEMSLEVFCATAHRTATASLEAVAKLWTPPAVNNTVNTDVSMDVANLLTQVDGLAYTMWKDGPLAGSDRSNTLARFAHKLAAQGVTQTAAFLLLKSADERWGKMFMRPDCDEQLLKLVDNAYAL